MYQEDSGWKENGIASYVWNQNKTLSFPSWLIGPSCITHVVVFNLIICFRALCPGKYFGREVNETLHFKKFFVKTIKMDFISFLGLYFLAPNATKCNSVHLYSFKFTTACVLKTAILKHFLKCTWKKEIQTRYFPWKFRQDSRAWLLLCSYYSPDI